MALVYAQTKPPDTYLSSTVIFPTHPFPHSTLLAGDNVAGVLLALPRSQLSPPNPSSSLSIANASLVFHESQRALLQLLKLSKMVGTSKIIIYKD